MYGDAYNAENHYIETIAAAALQDGLTVTLRGRVRSSAWLE